jgi:predicted 3-demethylubiquinone-9 3-methyltransferase (glyoxalase superfamily)
MDMQKIHPFLWFDTQAEEAAKFYVSTFKNSKITSIARYPDGGPMPKGRAMTVGFELDGQQFTALNAGPHFKFNEAVSFVVDCKSQEEVDEYWTKLTADGGQPGQCGWLKDKYGLSWQITPTVLIELVTDPDPAKAGRAMAAMMQMTKIDIAKIKEAAKG